MPSDGNLTSRRNLLQQTALAAGAGALLSRTADAQPGGETWKLFYPSGFRQERVKTSGAEINAVIGGSGPPVLLFHGAPQSVITWRLIAPDLARDFTLVMCDLRGYGDSSKPEDRPDHSSQSKRPMALDGIEVMEQLGHREFFMVGHDRGGRVGRRMALDHPDRVRKLVVMDIVPAHYLYSHVTIDFVQAYFHWFNYLRRAPGPENELKAANDARAAKATDPVEKEYLRHNTDLLTIHAMCEDYRASASLDLAIDEADIKAGKKIQCLSFRSGPPTARWANSTTSSGFGKRKPSTSPAKVCRETILCRRALPRKRSPNCSRFCGHRGIE